MGSSKGKGRRPKKEATGVVSSEKVPGLASMERTMADLSRLFGRGAVEAKASKRDARRAAQELVYEAWERPRKQDRIQLAEQALQQWPDCADAYNLLAEDQSGSIGEARSYYEKGVRAGERALGPAAFEDDVGHFWGILETRPYMRARAGLAECLWSLGEEAEALEHYHGMLRLNPNDNQGIRDTLLTRLLGRGDEDAAGRLLEAYSEDGSANWLYNRALWLFRKEGPSSKANRRLAEALETNKHVPAYLLGKKRVPRRLPNHIGWGDESEAQVYAAEGAPLWKQTHGARDWLLRSSQKRK